MNIHRPFGYMLRTAVCTGVIAALAAPTVTLAQEDDDVLDVVIVTGTRIQNQNVIAASPITTIGQEEIALKQPPNIERVEVSRLPSRRLHFSVVSGSASSSQSREAKKIARPWDLSEP